MQFDMATVKFPTLDNVLRDIEINKTVHKIKKLSFMNGCDTSVTYKGVKTSIISDPKALKRMRWVQDLDANV